LCPHRHVTKLSLDKRPSSPLSQQSILERAKKIHEKVTQKFLRNDLSCQIRTRLTLMNLICPLMSTAIIKIPFCNLQCISISINRYTLIAPRKNRARTKTSNCNRGHQGYQLSCTNPNAAAAAAQNSFLS
jgi:hypothetical protein